MLNGKPIRDYDFMTRAVQMFLPVSLNLDEGPGRRFFFASGYDSRMTTYFSPNGDDLSDSPRIRSMFQEAIGLQNSELKLDKLSRDPKAIESLQIMNRDRNAGLRGEYNAGDYYHNMKISQIIEKARRLALASIMNKPEIVDLRNQQQKFKLNKILKQRETTNIAPILNMYK